MTDQLLIDLTNQLLATTQAFNYIASFIIGAFTGLAFAWSATQRFT